MKDITTTITPDSEQSLTDIHREIRKEKVIRILAIILIIVFPIALLLCFKVVKQYRRAVILRFGRVRADSPAGPGVIWVVPCTDSVIQIDLRTQSINLPPQMILTRDYVTVTLGAIVHLRVYKPVHCLLNVRSHKKATEMLAVAVLRNIVCRHTLTDLLLIRESLSRQVKTDVGKVTAEWGVKIEQVEIKDIVLPVELQKAMAAEAEGKRVAQAKIIESEGEVKTAEHLKEASGMMAQNPQIILSVRQFEKIVILRNGKVRGKRCFGPGLIFYLPCIDTIKYIDLRVMCYTVPPEECLTKDSLTLTVQAVVYYKVIDPLWAIINVADFNLSTEYLAATALRNTIGRHNLTELLVNRAEISSQVCETMRLMTDKWGIRVIRIEMNNVSLPLQLKKAMAAEAVSLRLANAKITVAKSEIEATKSLEKATAMLMENPLGMQLRYLQSLQMIAGDKTHTVVFPYSKNMFQNLFGNK